MSKNKTSGKPPRRQHTRTRVTIADTLPDDVKSKLEALRDTAPRKGETARRNIQKTPTSTVTHTKPLDKPQVLRPARKRTRAAPPVPRPTNQKSVSTSGKSTTPSSSKKPKTAAKLKSQPARFSYWDLPLEAAVRDRPPAKLSKEDREVFNRTLDAATPSDDAASGDLLFAIIGLDFGTSSTKVIVRFPFEPGEPTIAIPAPRHCLSADHPYLWQTVLWLRADDEEYLGYPERGGHLLHSLKQGVVTTNAEKSIYPDIAGEKHVTRINAASAYLAFVMRYVRGWLVLNRTNLFRGREPVWFVNAGMPAAGYDDSRLVKTYRRVAAAALDLANSVDPIRIDTVEKRLNDHIIWETASTAKRAEEVGVAVIPETAAEATGFAKSAGQQSGLYVMVDVGALTLDVCSFRLNQDSSGKDRYPLFSAEVRPLGVEAYHWFLSEGRTERGFIKQSDRCLKSVVWDTKVRRDPGSNCWKAGGDLPVYLTGGGSRNALHRRIVEALGPWLQHHTKNGGIRLLELPIPRTIDLPMPIEDFQRLGVAWGLSYPPDQIGEITPMSAIDDIPPLAPKRRVESFISKDQV
jgi:hypothetical protein